MTQEDIVTCTSLGSWWTTSSGLSSTPQAVESGHVNPESKNAVGGAKAQSRFSGKSAMPLFRAFPESCSLHEASPSSGPKQDAVDWALKSKVKSTLHVGRGRRCDGVEGNVSQGSWVWSMEKWQWEREGNPVPPRDTKSTIQSDIAARRWGDGRDNLREVVDQYSSRSIDKSVGKKQRLDESAKVKSASLRGKDARDGFACVGGFSDVKQKLME